MSTAKKKTEKNCENEKQEKIPIPRFRRREKKTSEFYDKLNVLLNLCEYENVISKN